MTNKIRNYFSNLYQTAIRDSSKDKKIKSLENKLIEKDKFLGIIAHDIRGPINALAGFADLLKNPGLNEEERIFYSNQIDNSSKTLMEVLNLVGLAGQTLTDYQRNSVPTNFKERIFNLYQSFPNLKEEGVQLNIEDSGSKPSFPESIANVLVSNTFGDSTKHALSNTPINVKIKSEGTNFEYLVSNSYNPNFRRRISGEDGGKGLPFMKYIVEQIYQGKLESSGKDGIYTTKISIPLKNLQPPKE